MLSFFPNQYPDEILYSVLARYHLRKRNSSFLKTIIELFGRSLLAVVDLPHHLTDLCNRLPIGSSINEDTIIKNHTLFPVYRPFLPLDREKKVIESMKNSRCTSAHLSLGLERYSVPLQRYLRYCPECLKADKDKYGESYWHRVHQISGVAICPHHGEWLVETNLNILGLRINQNCFHVLDSNLYQGQTVNVSKEYYDLYLEISKAFLWLLNNNLPSIGLDELRRRYDNQLKIKGFIKYKVIKSRKELFEAFYLFYGERFLQEINCGFYPFQLQKRNWLYRFLRINTKMSHPLQHIIVMKFLGVSPKDFFMCQLETNQPFGTGPWPCLNPIAEHYLKPVINKCEVTMNRVARKPIGTFSCSCGYSYVRVGPDKEEKDRYEIRYVKSFGQIYEEELLKLSEQKMSCPKISNILNIPAETIARHLRRIRSRPISENKIEAYLNECRIRIKDAITDDLKRSSIRKTFNKEIYIIERYDRCWLDENLPPRKKGIHNVLTNWAKKDEEYSKEVIEASKEILAMEDNPTRITKSIISKYIGNRKIILKIDILPKTQKALDSVCESVEDFRIRRAKIIIKKLKAEYKNISLSQVITMLYISKKDVSDLLIEKIQNTIKELT